MTNKEKLFAWLDGSTKGIVELESLLTAIPALAPESGGDGELKKAEALEAWLRKHGITDIVRYDSPDPRVSSGKRPNLVATIKGARDDGRVWIMSHTDVVPEGDRGMWKSDPYKVEEHDGKLWGRGVEDNQQGLVSGVFTALAFLENGIVPPRTIKLLFVADEEVGSVHGIQYLLKTQKLFRPDDFIFVPDGGSATGTDIEVAEKNILWMKVTTKGAQTHASMPDKGANAFLAACDLALRLHAMEKEVYPAHDKLFDPDYSTINPTKKEANVPNVNTIPGDDVFCMDMRILPCYPLDGVIAESEKRMRDIEKQYRVKVSYEILQRNESKATPADAPVVKELSKAIREVYKVEPKAIGIGGGSVAAYLRNAGFDSVVWSRLDETAHQPNESCKLENVIGDAKVFAALVLRD